MGPMLVIFFSGNGVQCRSVAGSHNPMTAPIRDNKRIICVTVFIMVYDSVLVQYDE